MKIELYDIAEYMEAKKKVEEFNEQTFGKIRHLLNDLTKIYEPYWEDAKFTLMNNEMELHPKEACFDFTVEWVKPYYFDRVDMSESTIGQTQLIIEREISNYFSEFSVGLLKKENEEILKEIKDCVAKKLLDLGKREAEKKEQRLKEKKQKELELETLCSILDSQVMPDEVRKIAANHIEKIKHDIKFMSDLIAERANIPHDIPYNAKNNFED